MLSVKLNLETIHYTPDLRCSKSGVMEESFAGDSIVAFRCKEKKIILSECTTKPLLYTMSL